MGHCTAVVPRIPRGVWGGLLFGIPLRDVQHASSQPGHKHEMVKQGKGLYSALGLCYNVFRLFSQGMKHAANCNPPFTEQGRDKQDFSASANPLPGLKSLVRTFVYIHIPKLLSVPS